MAYSVQGLFTDLDYETLLDMRQDLIDSLSGGKSVTQWSSAGTSITKQFAMSFKDLLAEVNYAIRLKEGKINTTGVTYARFQ